MNPKLNSPVLALPLPQLAARPTYHWYVVGTVCVGAFMAALDGSIVTVALPTITRQFHTSVSATEWIALAYLLTLTALLAVFGRLADIVGRRPLYTLGFVVFIIASALAGIAQNLAFLIAARVLQAIGACMLQANSVAIITAAVPASVRGRAIGIQGTALAVGLSLGPAIGGILVGLWGWQAIFFVNIPVGIIGTTLAALILPRDKLDRPKEKTPFDYLGATILGVTLVSLLLGLNQGNTYGWASPIILSYLVIGFAGLAIFIYLESRHKAPLINLSLFRIEPFTWGNLSGSLSYAMMYGALYIVPYLFEEVMHKPSSESGLLTTPLPIGMMLFAPMAGRIADRYGSKAPTVTGMAVSTIGLAMLSLVRINTPAPYIIAALLLIGIGVGCFTPPNNSSVMGSAPRNFLGVASGVLNMSRSLGQSVGIAYAFAIFQGVLLAHGFTGGRLENPAVLIEAFRWTFASVGILSVAALAISAVRSNRIRQPQSEPTIMTPLE